MPRGKADIYSNIDLFCEVVPQDFASFVEKVDYCLRSDFGAIAEGLPNGIVSEFGKIGYINILKANEGFSSSTYILVFKGRDHGTLARTYRQEILRRIEVEHDTEKCKSLLYRLRKPVVVHATSRSRQRVSYWSFMSWGS